MQRLSPCAPPEGLNQVQCARRRQVRQLIVDFERDAGLDEVFVVLTLGATAIATLGLLSNSAAVVIGAMIIAPSITPLRATAFGILWGRLKLVVPLSGGFIDLVRSAREQVLKQEITETIERLLVRETVTVGQNARLDSLLIDWAQNPPLIRLMLRTVDSDQPTPKQVGELQRLINARQTLRFRLLVERSAVQVVGPETAPNPREAGRLPLTPPLPGPEPLDTPE